jgi:hypothetical protein
MCIENNRLGIFKTALSQVLRIHDLEVVFHLDSEKERLLTGDTLHDGANEPGDAVNGSGSLISGLFPGSESDREALVGTVLSQLTGGRDQWRLDLELVHISEIQINGFALILLGEDQSVLSIQSKRAMVSAESSGLLLRGHVTIEAGKRRLESNLIEWNVGDGLFRVKEHYVLDSAGVRRFGYNACFDAQLNPVEAADTSNDRKEDIQCLAKR